jgi:hypothetical protein
VRGAESEKAADDDPKPIALECPADALADFNASIEHGRDEHEAYERTVVRWGSETWNIRRTGCGAAFGSAKEEAEHDWVGTQETCREMKRKHRQRPPKVWQTQ